MQHIPTLSGRLLRPLYTIIEEIHMHIHAPVCTRMQHTPTLSGRLLRSLYTIIEEIRPLMNAPWHMQLVMHICQGVPHSSSPSH